MPENKTKIIESAQKLFFTEGIASLRLQQIADDAGISVGNLAYHFKNKEALVYTVYENLFAELSQILSQYMADQQLTGFDKQFSALYDFYMHNSFTSNNLWEIDRSYPDIQQEWLAVTNKILLQLKKRVEFNVSAGLITKELFKGAHEHLAQALLLTINCWIPQQSLRKKPIRPALYKRALWAIIYPQLTEQGILTFNKTIAPIIY